MNPQMQNYRQYAQAQTRSPAAARRPGECDASTWTHYYPPGIAQDDRAMFMAKVTPQMNLSPVFELMAKQARNPIKHCSPLRAHQGQNPLQYSSPLQAHQAQNPLQYSTPQQIQQAYLHCSGMPPNQVAAQQAQQRILDQQMAQRNAALEHQLAQRRARKPTDRNMPDGIEELIIGDGVQQYKEMRELERKLDYAMMRKRLDIQDTFSRNVKRQKTMRIWISNTADNQPWQRGALDENAFDFSSGGDATFRVKIEGRLLDEPEDDTLDSDSETEETEKEPQTESKRPLKKFSHFFKSITVDFDKARNIQIDPGMQVEWKKQPNEDFDCLEFQRKGDENLNVTINLVRDEQPERFRLSQALAATLDMEEADRAEVVMGIWEYVKAMGLQEDEERRSIRCDDRLRQIFGTETFFFPQVADRIMPHLHPLPPLRLAYSIRVDQNYIENIEPTIYDIKVSSDDPLRAKILAMTQNPQTHQSLREIARLDDQLAILIQAIQHHKARHTFFRNFSKDPVKFLKKWHSSQQHDLSVLLGDSEKGEMAGMEFAPGGKDSVWNADVVREAVRYRLAKAEAAR